MHLALIKILYKFKIKKLLNLLDIKGLKLNNFMKTLTSTIILKQRAIITFT